MIINKKTKPKTDQLCIMVVVKYLDTIQFGYYTNYESLFGTMVYDPHVEQNHKVSDIILYKISGLKMIGKIGKKLRKIKEIVKICLVGE